VRVLVTGSAGFIGSAVRAELAARGDETVPFDHPLDVRDAGQVRKSCAGADAVIHLAGMLGTSELLRGQHEAVDVNIGGALNVLDAAAAAGVPVVFIGTGHKGQPNTYAITKGCAEDLALSRAMWLGEKVAVVRAFHVYGPGQKPPPPWGSSPVRKFFPAFACQALSRQPLEVYGSGRQVIDPVHVGSVAAVLCDAIGGPYGEVIEAGAGVPVTVRQVALDIQAMAGVAGREVRYLPMRPGEPDDAVVVAGKPACTEAWPCKVAETIGWYRDWLTSHPS